MQVHTVDILGLCREGGKVRKDALNNIRYV